MHLVEDSLRNQPLPDIGLVCDHHQQITGFFKAIERCLRSRIKAKIIEPPGRKTAAIAHFRHDENPVTIEKHGAARGHARHRSPLGPHDLQLRVADKTMPNHGLEGLGQRCDPRGINLRHHHYYIAVQRGVTAILADNAENLCTA